MQYSTHLLRHTRLIIGKNIHRYRSKQKLPLWKLARLTGVSEFLLDYYELGKNELPFVEMLKIACALNVKLEDLLDDENGKAPEASVSAKSPSVKLCGACASRRAGRRKAVGCRASRRTAGQEAVILFARI